MEKLVESNLKLGIIAGGQLAKMLIQEASKLNITTYILDSDENCPAVGIASEFVKGNLYDFDSVYEFGKRVDVLTYEIEDINIEALKRLKSEGIKVIPDPDILEIFQDKGLQKKYYLDNDIPTSCYTQYSNKKSLLEAILNKTISFPCVQKLCRGGYDGQGVAILQSGKELDKLLDGPCIIEKKVDIQKEISVIVARNRWGDTKCFPAVEMVFNDSANLVERLISPANIKTKHALKAEAIAVKLIKSLEISGLLAVEFFIDKKGDLIVNESALRPHNSGHHTIESVLTSQFEQHIRAILELPLGSTQIKMPAVMVNLLGDPKHEGRARYEGLAESMAIEGVKIHLYGKKITRPFRKMGHITIVSNKIEEAIEKSEKVQKLIKVIT